jgi:Cu(I)/Ag(I) efflux system membrane protein CusA/SilA
MVMMTAIGGEPISTVVDGNRRITISVRYAREFRDNLPKLKRIQVHAPSGALVPLSTLADISFKTGPAMIRNENGLVCSYVFVDTENRDVGHYVDQAKKIVADKLVVPHGTFVQWSGHYENMQRVRARLLFMLPITFLLITLLLFANTKSIVKTGIVLLAVPFSMIGAIWFLWFLDYNISVAVWVGLIALMGLDAETGVFMLLYLDLSYDRAVKEGKLNSISELKGAIVEGAVKRIRPKLMSVSTTIIALVPVLWVSGLGADTLKRIAAPLVGGLVTSFLLELLVYPSVYLIWKERNLTTAFK